MSQSLLLDLYRNGAQAMLRTVETWQAEHADTSAWMVQDAVRECLGFPAAMQRLWKTTYRFMKTL